MRSVLYAVFTIFKKVKYVSQQFYGKLDSHRFDRHTSDTSHGHKGTPYFWCDQSKPGTLSAKCGIIIVSNCIQFLKTCRDDFQKQYSLCYMDSLEISKTKSDQNVWILPAL